MSSVSGPTGSQSSLREANSERILATVRQFGSITQVELSQATGLSPATVSTIVKQLLTAGTVETRHTVRSGRRAQLVTLAHKAGMLVGLHVGERSLRVAISDSQFQFLEQREMPLPADHRHDTTLDRAALLVSELVDGLGSTLSEVLAIGIAVPAPVDPATGAISIPGILPGWENIPLAEVVGRRLGRLAAVDNDANLGLLGEMRFGAARGINNVLYVRASYGVGAGIALAGDIHHGVFGIAGEVGHTLVDPQGLICRCGSRGCLNTVCGAQALVASLRQSRGTVTLTDVLRLAGEGDPGCEQVVIDAGGTLGAVVANTAVSLSPEVIVVGGELAQAGTLFIEPIREFVRRRIPLAKSQTLEVLPAQLGLDAELYGALARAADLAHVPSMAS